MPRLSVIVPVYKVEKYIHKCVDSILNQTFTDFELILVDDGSPDNCGKICDEYAKNDRRVRVIHKKNGGLSDARNHGINAAKGEIIGFVDSDDDIDLGMYKAMIEFMDECGLDMVCSDACVIKNNRRKCRKVPIERDTFSRNEGICAILDGTIDNSAWNKIYKRSIIGSIRYPKGRIYEDVATTYRFMYNANKIGYIYKPFYNYYKRKGSIVATSFNSKSRYDCFLGFKERLDFSIEHQLECVQSCRSQALSTALSTLTAFYANGEDWNSIRYVDVCQFIKLNQRLPMEKIKLKDRILLWGVNNFTLINILYANASSIFKRIGKL